MSPADAIKLCEGDLEPPGRHNSDGEDKSSRLVDLLRRLQSEHGSEEEDRLAASGE